MPGAQPTHEDRIVIDPEIMVGKPVVKGTRIPVARVLQHLADNPDFDDLFEAFPHLTLLDVQACLAYAHDHLEKSYRLDRRERANRRPD